MTSDVPWEKYKEDPDFYKLRDFSRCDMCGRIKKGQEYIGEPCYFNGFRVPLYDTEGKVVWDPKRKSIKYKILRCRGIHREIVGGVADKDSRVKEGR